MTKITTHAADSAKRLRQEQRAKAVYFFSGLLLSPLPQPRLATSSATITGKTLFISHQTKHR